MTTEQTIRMANQIAKFFASKPETQAIEGIAEHINKFWEKRMRAKFFEAISTKSNEFDQLVIKASKHINKPE